MSAFHSISGTAFPILTPTPLNGRVYKGKKNGELLEAAEVAGYDVLLTVDQGIPHQPRRGDRKSCNYYFRSSSRSAFIGGLAAQGPCAPAVRTMVLDYGTN